MKKIFVVSIAILIFAAGLGWWIWTRAIQPEANSAPNTPQLATPGQMAPDFSLKTADGVEISLASLRNQKPVIVVFWASWSPDSRRDLPLLNQLYLKYKDQVEVLAINLQEGEATIREYATAQGLSFPVLLDPVAVVSSQYGHPYTNTHFLIDETGTIRQVFTADINEDNFKSLLGS